MNTIGDLVNILKGNKVPEVLQKPTPGSHRYLQIEDLRSNESMKYALDDTGTLADCTDVIIAWDGANAGTVGFNLEGYIGSTLSILRPRTDKIFPPYLGYFLQGKFDEIQRQTTGATIPHVNRRHLENILIPLPPLEEQQRIARLLGQADRLRRLRRYSLKLSETYLQSVFLEIFGDPARNERGWEKRKLFDLCENITDGTHDTPERLKEGIPFITSKNIRPFEFDLSILEYVSFETHQEIIKRCFPKQGDILFTNIGANIGNAVVNTLPFEFSLKNVALIQPIHQLINNIYLEAYLNYVKESFIQKISSGGVQQFFSLEIISNFEIIVPPFELQVKFQNIANKYSSGRKITKESLRQAEGLFAGLLGQVFG